MPKNSQFNFFFVTKQLLLQIISPFSQGCMYIPFLNTQKKNRTCKVLTESNLLHWFHVLYCSPIGEVECRLHRSSLIISNAYLNYIKKKTLNSSFYMKYLIHAVKNKNKWFVKPITFPGKWSWILKLWNPEILKKASFNCISHYITGTIVKMLIYQGLN